MPVKIKTEGNFTEIILSDLSKQEFSKALDLIKEDLPVRVYEPSGKKWFTNVCFNKELIEKLEKNNIPFTYEETSGTISNLTGLTTPDVIRNALPERLKKALRPYQIEGISFAVNSPSGVLIGDEMGLGKTVQAIGVGAVSNAPLFVVCPSFLTEKWKREIEYWWERPAKVIKSVNDINMCQKSSNIIMGYGRISSLSDKEWEAFIEGYKKLGVFPPGILVVDEIHYLKNKKAKRTKRIKELKETMMPLKVIGLSGTPFTKGLPQEIHSIVELLDTTTLQKKIKNKIYQKLFYNFFAQTKKIGNKRVIIGLKNTDYLQRLFQNFSIRRLIKDVAQDLPPIIRDVVPIDVDEEAFFKELANSGISHIKEFLQKIQEEDLLEKMVMHLESARRALGLSKVPYVISFVEDLTSQNYQHIVILFEHRDALEICQKQLSENQKTYVITGSVSVPEREKKLQEFRKKGGILLAISKAVEVGLDFDFVDKAVIAELPWSPAVLAQVEGRFRMLTSQKPVVIHYLVGKGLEQLIVQSLFQKMNALQQTIGGFEDRLQTLNLM